MIDEHEEMTQKLNYRNSLAQESLRLTLRDNTDHGLSFLSC